EGKEDTLATPPGDVADHEVPPATLPRFEPFSPESRGSSVDVKLKIRLARLQLEAQEKERKADHELKLQVRRLEIEAEKEVKLKQLEVEAMKITSEQTSSHPVDKSSSSQTISYRQGFDVSKNIALVPAFRETEVDSYFNAFERIATALDWPMDMWPILLQCKLVGKAQEVVSSLPLEDSLRYVVLKEAILRAYELVPEAYRQKFRTHKKSSGQTYVEFARDKGVLFDKWCMASEVKNSFESLRQLILLEDFKSTLPEKIVMFLNEQKVASLSRAAVMADEFVLTHKNVFVFASSSYPDRVSVSRPARPDPGRPPFEKAKGPPSPPREARECFYCHKRGHVIADCLSLKRKQSSSSLPHQKGMGLIKKVSPLDTEMTQSEGDEPDPCFKPFISGGFVSLTGDAKDQLPVKILRDTGRLSVHYSRGSTIFIKFPEAIPLRKITAPIITKALVKFFSVFGLPKVVQSDQGTNFRSRVFAQALKTLGINHVTSSPYHPESQGALERFHQTLKSMLRKYCHDSQRDWDEGVPLVLFAAREAVQESLGFSPAELVFGHEVRGPLKVLKEHLVMPKTSVKSIPEYVTKLKDRLQLACSLAREALASSQLKMKKRYDRKAVVHSFQPEKKLSENNYVVKTPDRRRQTRVCHVNMMKMYRSREDQNSSSSDHVKTAVSPMASVSKYTVMPFGMCNAPATFQRLVNKVLGGVENCKAYLDDIVVYSDDWISHVTTLREVFTRLSNASLTLNLAKCEFGKGTVFYLGQQVGQGQVCPVDIKITAIATFPVPTTRRELRRFLGMVGYYRRYCKNFSSVAAPLTALTSPLKPFTWNDECQQAFECLKGMLSCNPVLSAPDFSVPFKLEVDASAVGAGAVLLQEDTQGIDHPDVQQESTSYALVLDNSRLHP
ncbi:hypothetical protein L3Q82_016288, partial [Scortum barcoo]